MVRLTTKLKLDSIYKRVAKALDGCELNQSGICDRAKLDSVRVKKAVTHLIEHSYLKKVRNKGFKLTSTAHAELMQDGDFSGYKGIFYRFQIALPRTLTANSNGDKEYLY